MVPKQKTFTLELFSIEIDVVYRFYPGEEEITYYQDGSGYPGTGDSVEIDKIWTELKAKNGRKVTVDILPFVLDFEQQDLSNLEEMIIEYETDKY